MSKFFTSFVGTHSFLIGLFPFFIPVFLWNYGYNLTDISTVITFTGLGYIIMLYAFDRLKNKNLNTLIMGSFIIESGLLSLIFILDKSLWFIVIFGLLNGIYNCLFWIIQRLAFIQITNKKNTGKKFGHLQIFVFVILKIAILISAFILESGNFTTIFILSLLINTSGILFFQKHKEQITHFQKNIHTPPLSIKQIIKFKDKKYSRLIFLLDGPFLFLESYFWILSLFFITNNNFLGLGLLSIFLALFFSLSFWFIKNKIDHINVQKLYIMAVTGYALSWFLRSFIDAGTPLALLSIFILTITFFTSFFRLTFNKRFFDITHHKNDIRYIFQKSYYSQFSIFIFFGLLSIILNHQTYTISLTHIYFFASLISLFFMCYKFRSQAV